jgi:predicted Zn-dependent protease
MIEGLIYGEDPRQGFVEQDVFYHPELAFRFDLPAAWNHQNSPSKFQVAPKDGKALLVLTLSGEKDTESAVRKFLQEHQLSALEQSTTKTNGLHTTILKADQIQQNSSLRTISYFIQMGDMVYHLMGLAQMDAFPSVQATLEQSMRSFKKLNEPDKLNRKPERIMILEIASTATLEEILRREKIPANRLEEFAILNGMKLEDKLEKGDLIKVIRRA